MDREKTASDRLLDESLKEGGKEICTSYYGISLTAYHDIKIKTCYNRKKEIIIIISLLSLLIELQSNDMIRT